MMGSGLRAAGVVALIGYTLLVGVAAWRPPLLPSFLAPLQSAAEETLALVGIEAGRTVFEGDPADSIVPRRLCPTVVGERAGTLDVVYRCGDSALRLTADTRHDTVYRIALESWKRIRMRKSAPSPVFSLLAWACYSPQIAETPFDRTYLVLDVQEMDFVTGERVDRSYTSMSFDCTSARPTPPPWPQPRAISQGPA